MESENCYSSANSILMAHLPNSTQRVLDLGCGTGALGRIIKDRFNCQVVGVTISEAEASIASKYLDLVFIQDLNNCDLRSLGIFDCVICSHVLEHLYWPDNLLTDIHKILAFDGTLVIALPNPLHWRQRLEFLKGNFKYSDGGVMDRTHFRFFDWDTSLEIVKGSDYQVIQRYADGYFPLPGIRNRFKLISHQLDKLASKALPGLFGCQFIIVAQPNANHS